MVYIGYVAIWLNVLKSDINLFQNINITTEYYNSEILDNTNKNYQYKYNSNNDNLFMVSNCISIFIAILGYTLLLLYITIGKGSKYRYECYEGLINNIEHKKSENKLYIQSAADYIEENKVNNSIFKRVAGNYSVSKINILSIWTNFGFGMVYYFINTYYSFNIYKII